MRNWMKQIFVLLSGSLLIAACQNSSNRPITGIRSPIRFIPNPRITILNAQPVIAEQAAQYKTRVNQLNEYLERHRDLQTSELRKAYSARVEYKSFQGELARTSGGDLTVEQIPLQSGLLSSGVKFNRTKIKQLARGADVLIIPFYRFRKHSGDFTVSVENYGNYIKTTYCPDVAWETLQVYQVAFAADGVTLYTDFQIDLAGFHTGLRKRILMHQVVTIGGRCGMRPIASPEFKHALPDFSIPLPIK